MAPAQRNAPRGRPVVVDLAARRLARQRPRPPRRPAGYVYGASRAPRIVQLDRQLAERGTAPADRLAHAIALPDREWDALYRDLRQHIERERGA